MALKDVKAAPSAADGLAMTEVPSWANSAWVEVIANTLTAISIIRVQNVLGPGQTVDTVYEGEFGIGIGAVNAEQEKVTIPFCNTPDTSVAHYHTGVTSAFTLPEPYQIPQGNRVSFRVRLSDVTNFGTGKFKLTYQEETDIAVVYFKSPPLVIPSQAIQDRSRW